MSQVTETKTNYVIQVDNRMMMMMIYILYYRRNDIPKLLFQILEKFRLFKM